VTFEPEGSADWQEARERFAQLSDAPAVEVSA
jgi:hypothetical protein